MSNIDLFQAIGGTPQCRKLSRAFYDRVQSDPVLRPFFPGKSMTCAIEAFSAFLVQFLGGPSEDSQRRYYLSLQESHQRFELGEKHRGAWLRLMREAIKEVGIKEPSRSELNRFFEEASGYLLGKPPKGQASEEMERRWQAQQALDKAAAAIHDNDANAAIELSESCDRAVLPGLLALMIASGNRTLRKYVHEQLIADPLLAQERYYGRTLLHTAAAAGAYSTARLLLRMGADPNALDGGKHTPLYSLGNECLGARGASVVRLLVRSGAQIDLADGVTHSTALHMAARRGNAITAKALLDCGANKNLRDIRGNTALQRAINCKKIEVADLLRSYH